MLTGGRFIAEELGVKLDGVQQTDLGRAHRLVLDKDTTTIIGGGGSKEAIVARCQEIRKQIEQTTSDYDHELPGRSNGSCPGSVGVLRHFALRGE